jgi:hypothetical protein
MHILRKTAATLGVAGSAVCVLVLVVASGASASTRLRSGALHAQLAGHLSGTSTASSSFVFTGSDIMTFIRRGSAGNQ